MDLFYKSLSNNYPYSKRKVSYWGFFSLILCVNKFSKERHPHPYNGLIKGLYLIGQYYHQIVLKDSYFICHYVLIKFCPILSIIFSICFRMTGIAKSYQIF